MISFRTRALACNRLLRSFAFLPIAFGCLAQAQTSMFQIKELDIAPAWSGAPIQFSLVTDGDRQYAGYYNADRYLTVAMRTLGSTTWAIQTLPTQVDWDSHKYIAMAVDRDRQLHVIGNLHVTPLNYFRTAKAGDISTLVAVDHMTGNREQRMTYPQFIKNDGDELVFTYRDGGSGGGDTIYNRYDEKNRTWTRLLDQPLFDGKGHMNAYPIGPLRGPDGYWHLTWVWRDTPDASTNHDLSYARSKDLLHWETVAGASVKLPITLETPGVILDAIPSNGGIINGSGKIGFDDHKRVVVAYHKFDPKGSTQMYLTRFEESAWVQHRITDWTYRWEPKGGGTLAFDIYHSALEHDPQLGYYISFSNKMHGKGVWQVDPETLRLGKRIPDEKRPGAMPSELLAVKQAGMTKVNFAGDSGTPPKDTRYVLRWETLAYNRDRPNSIKFPPASPLHLVELPADIR